MLRYLLTALALPAFASLALAGVTSKPDPVQGKFLAEKLCTNCHLVGSAQQQQPANADVPSFKEIAGREDQSAGAITARIMLPKHPMLKIVVKELHKDLTKVPDHELTGHLAQ